MLTTVDSSSTSLTESIELTNKTTLEAGTDTAKVSDELEVKFGISKESPRPTIPSPARPPLTTRFRLTLGRKVVTVYTEDRSVVEQPVDINALCDWGSIRIGLDSFFHDSGPKSHYLFDPRNTLIKGSRTQHYFEVNGWDALISVLMGYDIRAPGLRALVHPARVGRGQDSYRADDVREFAAYDVQRFASVGESEERQLCRVSGNRLGRWQGSRHVRHRGNAGCHAGCRGAAGMIEVQR